MRAVQRVFTGVLLGHSESLVKHSEIVSIERVKNWALRLPQMNSQAAVFPRTFQTNPNAIRYTDPLGVVGTALKTGLERKSEKKSVI